MPVPNVKKISALFTAVKLYFDGHGGSDCGPHSESLLDTPCLASWDASNWYELIQDMELVDFLVSDTSESNRLLRSLQSYLQWRAQNEINLYCRYMRINN